MRKIAQERKRVICASSTSCDSSSSSSNHTQHSLCDSGKESFYDTGGITTVTLTGKKQTDEEGDQISMDEIWKDIDMSKDTITPLNDAYKGGLCGYSCTSLVSPWEYCPDSIWRMNEDDNKTTLPANNYFQAQAFCEAGRCTLTGT